MTRVCIGGSAPLLLLCAACVCCSGGGSGSTTVGSNATAAAAATATAPPSIGDTLSDFDTGTQSNGACCPPHYAEASDRAACFRLLAHTASNVSHARHLCNKDGAKLARIARRQERIYARLQIGHTHLYNSLVARKKHIKNGIWIDKTNRTKCTIYSDRANELVDCSGTSKDWRIRPLCTKPKSSEWSACCARYFTLVEEGRRGSDGDRLPPRCFLFVNERRGRADAMRACHLLNATLARVDEAGKVANRVIDYFKYIEPDMAWIDLHYRGSPHSADECKYAHEDGTPVCRKDIQFAEGYPKNEVQSAVAVVTAGGVENENELRKPLRANEPAGTYSDNKTVTHGFICMKPSEPARSSGGVGVPAGVIAAIVAGAVLLAAALAAAVAAVLLLVRRRARAGAAPAAGNGSRSPSYAACSGEKTPASASASASAVAHRWRTADVHAATCPRAAERMRKWKHDLPPPPCHCASTEAHGAVSFVSTMAQ